MPLHTVGDLALNNELNSHSLGSNCSMAMNGRLTAAAQVYSMCFVDISGINIYFISKKIIMLRDSRQKKTAQEI